MVIDAAYVDNFGQGGVAPEGADPVTLSQAKHLLRIAEDWMMINLVESGRIATTRLEDGTYRVSRAAIAEYQKNPIAQYSRTGKKQYLGLEDALQWVGDYAAMQEIDRLWQEQYARTEEEHARKKARKDARKSAILLSHDILRAWCKEHPDDAYKLAALNIPPAPNPKSTVTRPAYLREKEVLERRARGETNKQIADALPSNPKTGKPLSATRISSLYAKGCRLLRNPHRAAQLEQYRCTGTFDSWYS